jgi:iron complex outermembrane recepter protein
MHHNKTGRSLSFFGGGLGAGAATVALLAMAAPPALAQDTDSNEIVVTAQKREERLLDVPIAISVVSPQLLASTNSRNLAELQGALPSLFVAGNHGGGKTYVTVRGATGTALNAGDEPVAIYMDDVYLARGVTVGETDLLDIASVEVVRGPQGTLQGRNATAGAILLNSADPTADFEGHFSASAAAPAEFRSQLALSGPLGHGFMGRVAAGYTNERGWAHNVATDDYDGGARATALRGVVKYDNGAHFTARIVTDYNHIVNEPALFRYSATQANPSDTGAYVLPGTSTPDTLRPQNELDEVFKHNRIDVDPGTTTLVETGGLAARMTYDFGGAELVSVTGYRQANVSGTNDSDGLASMPRQGYNHNSDNSRQFSEELRLQSTGDQRLSWITGLYAYGEHQDYTDIIYNLKFTTASNGATNYSGVIDTVSYAAFADATLHLTDKVAAVAGIRYTQDMKDIDATIEADNLDTGASTLTPYTSHDDKWSDTTYRAKLVYTPTEDIMFYLSYGTGFRAGGYNPFAVQSPYKPEGSESTEVGAKGAVLDHRLTYSVAAYHNDYTELQLRAGVPSGGAIITNAGSARADGVEAEFTATPTEGFRVAGNVAYTDAKFTSFPRAIDVNNHQVDATGNHLVRTPKWQYYLSAQRDFALGARDFTAELNYRWRDVIYFYFTDQDAKTWQSPAGGELGARLTLHGADDKWSASLFGTNLTNERLINTSNVTFSNPLAGLDKPRVVGVSVERNF